MSFVENTISYSMATYILHIAYSILHIAYYILHIAKDFLLQRITL